MAHTAINPDELRSVAGMSWAVDDGRTVHLSGQVAMDASGEIVGIDDPAAQAEQIFANIVTVLSEVGLTLADVVSLRCFALSVEAYRGYAAAKAKAYPSTAPAGTAVLVAGLLDERFLLEVEAVAVRS